MWRRARGSVRALGCALVLLAAARAPAQGGPPLVTDDPGTPGPGNWEVNVAATLDRTSLASSWGTPLVDANYGWGERVQLKLEMPFAVVSDADGTRGGIGNPLFGVKWRFLDEETAGVALGHSFGSVEAIAEVFSTHGDDATSRQVLVNLGGRVPVSVGSTLLVSGGWSLSDSEGPRHALLYLGLQLTSGRKGTP